MMMVTMMRFVTHLTHRRCSPNSPFVPIVFSRNRTVAAVVVAVVAVEAEEEAEEEDGKFESRRIFAFFFWLLYERNEMT